MRLEGQKFALYLIVPIAATLVFNEPSVQKWAADYFQFMKYPSNPKTHLMDEFESLKKERVEEIEWEKKMASKREKGRDEYLSQLKQLSAANSRVGDSVSVNSTEASQKKSWFGWLKRGSRGGVNDEKASSTR